MNKLNSELESAFNSMVAPFQKAVDEFRSKIIGSTLSHTLNWHTASALRGEAVVDFMRGLKDVCIVNEDFDVEDVIGCIEVLEDHAMTYFKGGQFAPSSTCAMANSIAIAKGEAYGKCLEMTETLTRIIERHTK